MTETRLAAGTATSPRADKLDRMAYVVSGSISMLLDGQSVSAETGDSLYIPAGRPCTIAALHDALVLDARVPRAAV